jgi:protein-S-isoprenylcysteine O-methyltransferase Ste14
LTWQARARQLRLPLGFLFAALYMYFARPSPLTFAVGVAIAFVGLLIRGWASGHIVKNDRLATTGPYAHTRNPLYFGSFLIGAGFAIAGRWPLLVLVIAFFVLIYWPTMEKERSFVRGRFPAEYDEYERNVPAFVPRPSPWRQASVPEAEPFSFSLYLRHKEWRAALGFVAAVGWLLIRMR